MAHTAYPGEPMPGFEPQPFPNVNHKPNFNRKTRGSKNNSYRGKKFRQNQSRVNNSVAHPGQGPPPHSCYNCGSHDHWAQHCPEPRRDFPAGADNHGRPPKRQKTMGPGPMPFNGDPHPKRQHRPERGYTHPQMANDPYHPMQMPGPYGPPPTSTHHGYEQWPQASSPPQYHSYPAHDGHGPAPPMGAYGPQYSGSPPSHMHHDRGYYPPEHHAPYGDGGYRRQSAPEYETHNGKKRPQWQKRRYTKDGSSMPPPPEPRPEDSRNADNSNQIIWRPAMQAARPLPSLMAEKEEAIPFITSLPPGMSVSQYFLDKTAEEFNVNIRNTEDWPFVMADPIFQVIGPDSVLVTVAELVSRRNKLFETHRVQKTEKVVEEDKLAEDGARTWRSSPQYCQVDGPAYAGSEDEENGMEHHSVSDRSSRRSSVDRSVDQGDYMSPQSLRSRGRSVSYSSSSRSRSEDPPRSPVSQGATESSEFGPPPSRGRGSGKSYTRGSKKPNAGKRQKQHNYRDYPNYQEQYGDVPPNTNYRGNKFRSSGDRRGGRGGRGAHFKSTGPRNGKSSGFSGPGKQKSKKYTKNGVDSMPPQDSRPPDNSTMNIGAENTSVHNDVTHTPAGAVHSTPSHKKENGVSHVQDSAERSSRKRPLLDGPGDEVDREPRRQYDDITPKFKRRQPNVAEAYSRRW